MEVQPINYAPALPLYQQRRVQKPIVAAVVLLAFIAVGVQCGPGAWNHAKLLYWQNNAMRYTPPADQKECGMVDAWLRFGELAAPPGPRQQPVLFLHERVNSRGEARLVAVERGRGNPAAQTGADSVDFWATVFRPGGLFSSPAEQSSAGMILQLSGSQSQVHWCAGQPDAVDGSHFTISYEMGGKRHILDGWLHDNDTVTLEPRK